MKLYESKYLDVELPANVERAWIVAQAANKPLVVVTGDKLFLKFLDYEGSPHRFIEQPCPCGFFGSDVRKCDCSAQTIEKHQLKLREKFRDCIWIEGWISNKQIKFKGIDEACQMLVKAAQRELRLTADQVVTLIDIAESIAKLDNGKIEPAHIAEAISYRARS